MLRLNGSNFNRIRPLGGAFHALGFSRVAQTQRLKENFSGFGQQESMPSGYQSAARATIPTLQESARMSIAFRGEGFYTASAQTLESAAVAFLGDGTFTPNAQHGISMNVHFPGEGTFTITARQLEQMMVAFDSGSRPSAFDIAQEIWQSQAASYSAPGTMGEALNDAALGGAGGGLTPTQEEQLASAARNAGLIPALL
jgi:hypothetical protein